MRPSTWVLRGTHLVTWRSTLQTTSNGQPCILSRNVVQVFSIQISSKIAKKHVNLLRVLPRLISTVRIFLMLDLLLILAIGVTILRCLLEQIVLVIWFVIEQKAMKTRSVLGPKGLIMEHSLAHTTVRRRTDCMWWFENLIYICWIFALYSETNAHAC